MAKEEILKQTVKLSNGVDMPVFGLGVWKSTNADAAKAVESAIAHGYRLIDTAKQYGNQPGVGAGIQQALKDNYLNRRDLFITTKVYNGDQGYESTLRAFDEQLKELRLTYLDLLLIHWPVDGKYIDTWRAMERLYLKGKVRAIGISNFDITRMKDVIEHTDIMPQVNQMEFNPLVQEDEILTYMNSVGMTLEAWSPLGGGEALSDPTINEIAQKHQKSAAQVILRFDYQMGLVTIPKSIHEERIIANSQLDDFELSKEEMTAIRGLNQERRSLWYDDFAWHTPHRDGAFTDSVDSWPDRQEYLPQ